MYVNKNFFIGSWSPCPIKGSPKRLTGLRFIPKTALDVTAILGTVVCNYWICLHQRNLDSEALVCKFFNEVNEASTFSNGLYDLPLHTAAVSYLQMRKTFRWGTQGGRGSDTSPASVLSAHTLACSPARSWRLLLGPHSFSLNPRPERLTSGTAGVLCEDSWWEMLFSPHSPCCMILPV